MASPVLTMMDPDDPLVAAPELKLRVPLAPFEPESNVRITNDPLLDIVPLPGLGLGLGLGLRVRVKD